jgi:hypothetical protein
VRRPRPMRLLGVGVIACLVAGGVHALAIGAGGRDGSARATGYGVILGSGSLVGVTADSTGIRSRTASAGGLGGDSVGTVGSVSVEVIARPDGTTGDAGGSVVARDLRLFRGRVTVGEVRVDARATAALGAPATASASVSVSGLTVDGAAVAAGTGSSIQVPGAGVISVGEVAPQGAPPTSTGCASRSPILLPARWARASSWGTWKCRRRRAKKHLHPLRDRRSTPIRRSARRRRRLLRSNRAPHENPLRRRRLRFRVLRP